MSGKITIDVQIKEDNGHHLITIDKMKNVSVEKAIELLKIKYATKDAFAKLCKHFSIMAKDLEDYLNKKNAKYRK